MLKGPSRKAREERLLTNNVAHSVHADAGNDERAGRNRGRGK